MTENEIRDRLFGTEERNPNRTAMNKIEALELVRFLRCSLYNGRGIDGALESLEEYITNRDAEVIRQTLAGIYKIPDENIVMKPLEEVEK